MGVPSDRVEATLTDFARWARDASPRLSGDPGADAQELRLLLGMLRDHVGVGDPADLGPGDLRELLLRVYPREVTALDAKDSADTVPALRDLLTFLSGTGAVAAKTAKRLARELDEVAPQFESAAMDDENLFGDLREGGGDLDDLELGDPDLDDDFGLDDEDLKEVFGLPDRLPPVRLPPEPELAATCRAAPLLGRARRLAEWAGPGRDLTWEEELTVADTAAAARELGIAVPVKAEAPEALPGMPEPPAITSMQDVPELARLWEIALDVGFLELDVGGTRA
jgi:hypothetical protein